MELNLRIAEERDLPALVEFNLAMASETEGLRLPLETLTAGIRSLMANPRYGFYVVAEEGAQTIGSLMITYEWSDWRDGLFWWVQSVYVKPDYRRRGVYSRLYKFAKGLAAGDGRVRGFRLYVEGENLVAQRTYERLGMTESHYRMYEELL
jgi:ribosomal protein S18 acetylase RimI-like enzyme